MPQAWKDMAQAIGRSLRKRGVKDAESKGYAIATSKWKKKYHTNPMSDRRKQKWKNIE